MKSLCRLAFVSAVCWAAMVQSTLAQYGADAHTQQALLGEYDLLSPSANAARVGLQLTFVHDAPNARLYFGGLPGTGWNQSKPVELSGAFSDGLLQLQGDGFQIDFLPDQQPRSNSHATNKADRSGFLTAASQEIFVSSDHLSKSVNELSPSNVPVAEVTWPSGTKSQLIKVDRHGVTLGQRPPANAIVLFGDDSHPHHLLNPRVSPEGYLMIGTETDFPVQSFRMHVEFRIPYMPSQTGQARGNSGIYIQRRYEVQVLDSFAFAPVKDGCASLYKQRPADVNMSAPPGKWQSYDLFFEKARWDSCGNKIRPAHISVIHNGVPVHYRQPIIAKTGAGKPEGPEPMPILFQDHGDPVVFRNIWLIENGN
jgi:Domain of Unknown Function (DUF1080)